MEGLQATYDISGNNGGWGNGWSALIGGAVGGALGSAWDNNRNGNCGCNNGCGCGSNGTFGDLLLMNSVSGLRTDVGSIGRDQLLQGNAAQSAMCQGFAGAVAATERIGSMLAQGQSRTEAAVLTTGLQGQIAAKDNTIANLSAAHHAEVQGLRNTFDIVASQKDCCCETQRTIERGFCGVGATSAAQTREIIDAIRAEGAANRALVSDIDRANMQRLLCDKDAEIAALKSQQFNVGLTLESQKAARHELNDMKRDILHFIRYHSGEGAPAAGS